MTETVRSVACYLLVDRSGALLLQERDSRAPHHPDKWTLPGGQIEPGETPEEAIHRELEEETEVVLGPGALKPWRIERRRGATGDLVDYHLFTAAVTLTDADIVCHEGRQFAFQPPQRFASLDLSESTAEVLEHLVVSERWQRLTTAHHFANVLLVDPSGAILLQERDSRPVLDPDCWGLPGGHMDAGESARDAAARELEEETGVRLSGRLEPESSDGGDNAGLEFWADVPVFHEAYGTEDVVHTFAAATTLRDTDIECREGRQMRFIAPDDIADLPLTHSAQQILPRFIGSTVHRRLQESVCIR